MSDEITKSVPPWMIPLLYIMGGGGLGAGTSFLSSEPEYPQCHDLETEVTELQAQHDALFATFQATIELLSECAQ